MVLTDMGVEELKALRDEVSDELKARRIDTLDAERDAKAEREAKFKSAVSEGDTIKFRFNKEDAVAIVIRVSEKSVTVEIDEKKKYVKYANILEVLEKAEKAESEDADAEGEDAEAVA